MSSEYQLSGVWPEPPADVRDEVVRFWLATGALADAAVARERSHQLLVIARNAQSETVGVSTAVRLFVQQLGLECFYYRTFIAPVARVHWHRSPQLSVQILHASYRLLNDRFQQGFDRSVVGLFAEIQNRSIMRHYREAVWQDDGMNFVFIGRTAEGNHCRVWYFEKARILLSARVDWLC